VRTHTKNAGEIAPRVSSKDVKTCCLLSSTQRGLSETYPAPILTASELQSVSACIHCWKMSEFLSREFHRL